MEVHSISFYNLFVCAAADCPSTCCKGWRVPVDRDSLHRYKLLNDFTGLKLRASIRSTEDGFDINPKAKTCSFYGRDGLCSLQCNKGEEYLPLVCRRYPRSILNYGSFVECTLELACPVASMLFLQKMNSMDFVISQMEDALVPPPFGTNDDSQYLNELLNSRAMIVSFLKHGNYSFDTKAAALLAYGRDAQEACIQGDFSFFDKDYFHRRLHRSSFSLAGKAMDLLITGGFYHKKLKSANPKLYELCKLYFKTYDSFTASEADDYFHGSVEILYREFPELKDLFINYYIYYLYSTYLQVYENYSFLKVLAKGIIHTSLLQLFFFLHYSKYGSLSLLEQAEIISSYEKRARHNDELIENMYRSIYSFIPE